MFKITVYDDFFKKELTGEFNTLKEGVDFYSLELGTEPENINITKVELIKEEKK